MSLSAGGEREGGKEGRREAEMDKRQAAKRVGVQIQFPVTVCSGSLFKQKNISSVKGNGSVQGKMKENRKETIH